MAFRGFCIRTLHIVNLILEQMTLMDWSFWV